MRSTIERDNKAFAEVLAEITASGALEEWVNAQSSPSKQLTAASINSSAYNVAMSPVEPFTTWETEYGTYQYLGYFPEENPTYPHKFLIDARVFWIDDCANYVLGLNKKANFFSHLSEGLNDE